DMVELRDLPPQVKSALDAWAGCVAGTIPVERYRQLMVDAGFEGVEFEITNEQSVEGLTGAIGSAAIRARKPRITN
ncbi:MAG TPA: arsenite S-adenosylmethyltransferase, partial [Candidatus Dormibacteraeota bacterium]|nr:arsenite S-adenosylmethyltransferase [Candidatus Dormibacteraeota bacterium]